MNQKGAAPLLPILAVLAFLSLTLVFKQQVLPFFQTNPAPAVLPSPSPSPSLTPSPSPSPIPTASPIPSPTSPPVSSTPIVTTAVGPGVTSLTVSTPKGSFSATILSVDLNSSKMITDTGNDSDCKDSCTVLPLRDYVARNSGFAGVNGSYFCPDTYPDCASKKNSYDFPVYNSRLNKWINQGNLFWGGRAIFYTDDSGAHYKQNASDFSGGLTAGVVNYPGLLSDGNVQIDDNQSGLSDKQRAKGLKVGIGLKDSKHIMVVIASNVTMQEFAYVFKSLGAVGALNLDTGGSTALISGGSYIFGPGRNLPNAIIFR